MLQRLLPAAGVLVLCCGMLSCGHVGQFRTSGGFAKKKFTRGLITPNKTSGEILCLSDAPTPTPEKKSKKSAQKSNKDQPNQEPKDPVRDIKGLAKTITFYQSPQQEVLDSPSDIHKASINSVPSTGQDHIKPERVERYGDVKMDPEKRYDKVAKAGFWLSIAGIGLAVLALLLTINPITGPWILPVFIASLGTSFSSIMVSWQGLKSQKYGDLAGVGVAIGAFYLGLIGLFLLGASLIPMLLS